MGKVIKFPSKEEQGMSYLEEGIRELMESKGDNDAAIDITIDTLIEVYKKYGNMGKQNFSLKLPPYIREEHIGLITQQITDGIQLLNHEHAKIINQLAAELVLTKVQLHHCQEALDITNNE